MKGISVVQNGVESSSEVLYDSVVYGTNVNVTNKKVDIDNVGWCHKVNLSKCKDRYIMIIADLAECQEILPHILSFSTCFTEEKTTMQKTGKVILMICSLRNTKDELNWDSSIKTLAKKCKPNILQSCINFPKSTFHSYSCTRLKKIEIILTCSCICQGVRRNNE